MERPGLSACRPRRGERDHRAVETLFNAHARIPTTPCVPFGVIHRPPPAGIAARSSFSRGSALRPARALLNLFTGLVECVQLTGQHARFMMLSHSSNNATDISSSRPAAVQARAEVKPKSLPHFSGSRLAISSSALIPGRHYLPECGKPLPGEVHGYWYRAPTSATVPSATRSRYSARFGTAFRAIRTSPYLQAACVR